MKIEGYKGRHRFAYDIVGIWIGVMAIAIGSWYGIFKVTMRLIHK